jgi:hypothetical protein
MRKAQISVIGKVSRALLSFDNDDSYVDCMSDVFHVLRIY